MRAISILTARSMNYSIITGGGKNSSRPHFSLYYLSYSNPVRRFIDKDDNTSRSTGGPKNTTYSKQFLVGLQ